MRLLAACGVSLFCMLTNILSIALATPDSILIEELTVDVVDSDIHVDCSINYVVDDKIKTAISNGIEISFVLDLELKMQREIWPDTTVAQFSRVFYIKYHALSKQFVMVDMKNGYERSFPDLYSAFYFMGNLHNNRLGSIDTLELEHQYYIRARARLQSEMLPLPLRIKSYFSPVWRPSSGWTSWPM